VPATAAGLLLMMLTGPARRRAQEYLRWPVLRAVVGGLILGGCGALAPLTLFSGHHQGQRLLDEVANLTVWGLLALAGLKLVATLAVHALGDRARAAQPLAHDP